MVLDEWGRNSKASGFLNFSWKELVSYGIIIGK